MDQLGPGPRPRHVAEAGRDSARLGKKICGKKSLPADADAADADADARGVGCC